nr:toprim domain-containing protein [Mesorhizobium sp.]
MDIRSLALALGGDVAGRGCLTCPGPGHGRNDRSLSVTFDDNAPDGFLVNSFAGDDFAACRDHVRYLLGFGSFESRRQDDRRRRPSFVPRQDPDTGKRVEFAFSLWQEAKAIGGTPAETYLHSRGIDVPGDLYTGKVLRFHPTCPFRLGSGETIRLPAMLAAMLNAETNLFQGVHRTALQPDGSGKAKVAGLASAKKMLGPSGGAVVKLTPDEDVTIRLNIAEGIEDALTVLGNFGIAPIWATMTSGTMKAFPVLPGIETLAIFANNDLPKLHGGRLHQAGNEAAQVCTARWLADDREASIWLPPRIGSDFNNLVERKAA